MPSPEQKRTEDCSPNMSIITVPSGKTEPESVNLEDEWPMKNEADDIRSKFDLNLMDFSEGGSSKVSSRPFKESGKRIFKCKYCKNKFSSSQALGGHQNAHRRERAVEKREKLMNDASAYDHIKHILARHPMTRPLSNSLGVDMRSMIHKPYNHWLTSNFGHGHHGWSRPSIMNQKPTMHQSQNGGFQSFGLTPPNGGFQPVSSMITTGSHGGLGISQHQQGESSAGLDLSLKL